MPEPHRGEVWLVDLGYVAKVRPCLVLSVAPSDTERALVTLVPHTTKPRQSRFEVETRVPFLRAGVFDAQSLVTVAFPKLLKRQGSLSDEGLEAIENSVRSWLGLGAPVT
jgi:mRNA interferase MazF